MILLNIIQEKVNNNKIINENKKLDITFLLLLSFVFFLPINQKASTILAILCAASSVLYIKNFKLKLFKSFIPLILLFIIYVIANFRDTYTFSIQMFELKAMLVAFPLIFSCYVVTKEKLEIVLKTFVYGSFYAYLILLIIAFINAIDFSALTFYSVIPRYREMGYGPLDFQPLQTNYFLGRTFAFTMQSTIQSIFFVFSIAIILRLKEEFKKSFRKIAIPILILGVLQIFSVIALMAFIFILVFNTSKFKILIIGVLTGFILFLATLMLTKEHTNFSKLETLDSRMIIWPTAIKTIKESPIIGFGYAKAQKRLHKNYPKRGDFGAISQQKKKDAHNTFLQINIESGLIGFLILLSTLIPYIYIKEIDTFIKTFLLLLLLCSLTESILNIYIGLAFFTFFHCLFINYLIHNEAN